MDFGEFDESASNQLYEEFFLPVRMTTSPNFFVFAAHGIYQSAKVNELLKRSGCPIVETIQCMQKYPKKIGKNSAEKLDHMCQIGMHSQHLWKESALVDPSMHHRSWSFTKPGSSRFDQKSHDSKFRKILDRVIGLWSREIWGSGRIKIYASGDAVAWVGQHAQRLGFDSILLVPDAVKFKSLEKQLLNQLSNPFFSVGMSSSGTPSGILEIENVFISETVEDEGDDGTPGIGQVSDFNPKSGSAGHFCLHLYVLYQVIEIDIAFFGACQGVPDWTWTISRCT